MALFDGSHFLFVRVVWEDTDLIEIEATVVTEGWCGQSKAYSTSEELGQFAEELVQFNRTLSGEARLESGRDDGIGLVAIRLYTIDAARHVACHVRLATSAPTGGRREQIQKLSVEVATEPTFLEEFAKGLRTMADTRSGQAILVIA